MATPAPPAMLTIRTEAWKSPPTPPRMLVSVNEAAGSRNSASASSTSRRCSSSNISPKNCTKLSLASLASGSVTGMKG